jgi:hypothetical protein
LLLIYLVKLASGAALVWILWVSVTWIAEAIIASPRIQPESLDAHLIRLAARTFGILAVLVLLLRVADDIGIPVHGLASVIKVRRCCWPRRKMAVSFALPCKPENFIDPSFRSIPLMIRFVPVGALVSILPFLAACASTDRPLMPTPTLYYQPPVKAVFGDVAPERRRPRVKLLFVTDRAPEENSETGLPYGEERARSLAFGNAVVEMAPALAWPELVRQSRLSERSPEITLNKGSIEELGRFPKEPYAMERTPGGLQRAQSLMAAHEMSKDRFQAELRRHLALSRN